MLKMSRPMKQCVTLALLTKPNLPVRTGLCLDRALQMPVQQRARVSREVRNPVRQIGGFFDVAGGAAAVVSASKCF